MSNPAPTPPKSYLNADLRLALSILYSLPTPTNIPSHSSERPTSKQSHEYLLQFQSRNSRRRLQSHSKSQGSQSSDSILTSEDIGSTWFACVHIVSSLATTVCNGNTNSNSQESPVHYAEALFAAQTMFHRLRRVKLSEAVDIEFEPFQNNSVNSVFPPTPQFILDMYRTWILESSDPSSAVAQLIRDYKPSITQMKSSIDMEERVKGELSMLVLANALCDLTRAFQFRRQQQQKQVTHHSFDSQERPLLMTLASAMTIIAARLRYTPACLPDAAPNTHPIVTMILGSISMIQSRQQQHAVSSDLYYVCLMAIPDSVLQPAGGDGGAYGRFSLEQRCFTALTVELKTQGMVHVWQCLQEIESCQLNKTTAVLLLQLLESWAKHVPMPNHIVEQSIPIILQSWHVELQRNTEHMILPETKAAMAYWIVIMESGALSVDQVLVSSLLQTKNGSSQPNKKRQSSRSKRRENQALEQRTTDDLHALAKEEVHHRGEIACTLAKATWPAMAELLSREVLRISTNYVSGVSDEQHLDDDVEGGGPIGAVTACATACLPYLLKDGTVNDPNLFVSISQAIQGICASPSRMVRSFAAESLYSLHEALSKSWASSDPQQMDQIPFETIGAHFHHCAMNLASGCQYPQGYFDDLALHNDDDLENERNDVRDLLRTVSSIPPGSTGIVPTPVMPVALGSSLLLEILQSCAISIQDAADAQRLFRETPLHTFSALAKPINICSSLYIQNTSQFGVEQRLHTILKLSLRISTVAGSCIVRHLSCASMNEILPLSRLFNLALASLSPMLSTLVKVPMFENEVITLLAIGIESSGTSLLRLPELTGPSTLRSSRFDIRGAMRSPGGEDHTGVLTLLRLANESDRLSRALIRSKGSVVVDLCDLAEELKSMEKQRGNNILHGSGVLPKSRRILIGVVCHLEAVSGGTAGASEKLQAFFDRLLVGIVNLSNDLDRHSAEYLRQLSDIVLDIGAFSPSLVSILFDVTSTPCIQTACLEILHESYAFVFKTTNGMTIPQEVVQQWNRLRASLFTLLTNACSAGFPSTMTPIIASLVRLECEATIHQCNSGPSSPSRIFHIDVISEESVPAGLFIQVLTSILSSASRGQVFPTNALQNVIDILGEIRQCVLPAIASTCGSPVCKESFHDPRPIIAETWLSAMNFLCVVTAESNTLDDQSTTVKELLVDTFVVVIALILNCSLEKTQDLRCKDPGMTLDGPQGLVMMEFLESFFKTGCIMLQEAGRRLVTRIPVGTEIKAEAAGVAIVGAALFRGSQGALPPWAVESIPPVYSALFGALRNNIDDFLFMTEISMSVRLAEHQRFGSVEGGELLSGKYFEKMSDNTRTAFLNQAKDLAGTNTAASWRSLKALIKQACGGKKKDTDFNQRPALTRFDGLDRI